MPLKTLDLDPLHLTYPGEQLRLSVISRVEFNFPSDVALHLDLAKFLVSGNVWVGNPRVCRIDMRFSLNDKPLDSENGARVLESLGSRMCEAKLWSQLSLSSSLEIPPPDLLNACHSDFSILLSQYSSTTSSTAYPRGWILDNVDVRAPPSVLSIQFQKLQVNLNFYSLKNKCLDAPIKVKRCWEESDFMLLDEPPSMEVTHLKAFKEIADESANNIPSSMVACFEQLEVYPPDHSTILFDLSPSRSQFLQAPERAILPLPIAQSLDGPTNWSERHLLPKEAKVKLQAWLDMHSTYPYPTNEEKIQLLKETGLQRKQVNRWLSTARFRLAKSMRSEQNEDDMLLEDMNINQRSLKMPTSCIDDDISLANADQIIPSATHQEPYNQDDILPFIGDEAPSLASPPSTQSSLSSNNSFVAHQLAPHPPNGYTCSPLFPLLSSSMLISAAFNVLIGGSACKRSLQSITLEKAFPKTPLTILTPTLFCPRFKQLMAHNYRFLPTISQTISSSWVRNCQGPGLRAKLLELSNLPSPGSSFGHATQSGETGSVERLSAVVQSRVWSMMQRKLSDPSMVGKLQWESVDHGGILDGEDPAMYEDLLASADMDAQNEMVNGVSGGLEQFITDGYMDEEELLLFDQMSDDEGLLSYFDEMEKIEVEKQTDEMLLGSEEYEDEDSDEVLLLDGDNEEMMLL